VAKFHISLDKNASGKKQVFFGKNYIFNFYIFKVFVLKTLHINLNFKKIY